MNIVIPMVGLGKRFSDAKYIRPKPLIYVKNKTIIQHTIESLNIDGKYIFIVRKTEYLSELVTHLRSIVPDSKIIEINYLTDGAVSSILLAKNLINNQDELITTNCDQRTDWDSQKFLNYLKDTSPDGCVTTYPHDNIALEQKSPYSFIKLDNAGNGIILEEKKAISYNALCGIHYWKQGKDFISSSEEMIKNNDRINNEFYVSKTYNYLINKNKKITIFPLKKGEFFSLGTPEDVKYYESL